MLGDSPCNAVRPVGHAGAAGQEIKAAEEMRARAAAAVKQYEAATQQTAKAKEEEALAGE
jgi:hypothetical protein